MENPIFELESTFPVDAIEFQKTYKVMDLRKLHGFSHFETSFLLGLRDFYVRDIENPLHSLQYTVPNNNYLRLIFNCGIDRILPEKAVPSKYFIRVFKATDANGSISYRIEKQEADAVWTLFREFTEEPKLAKLPLENPLTEDGVKGLIAEKFTEGYFKEARTALDLFRACQQAFTEPVRPIYVANALKMFTGKRKSPKLETYKNEMGRTVYRMI